MSGGFQFIDIVLFALVAGFLIFRLRSVLGRRDGHQGPTQDPFRPRPEQDKTDKDVIRLPERGEPTAPPAGSPTDTPLDAPAAGPAVGPTASEPPSSSLQAGLTQIKIGDPRFNEQEFAGGAAMAFEMILAAYVAGDTGALKPLLSPEVFANFAKSIEDRKAAGEVLDITLVSIQKSEIEEAYMAGRTAHVTLRFVSEQVTVTRNAAGDAIEGDADKVIPVTDVWTFARDTRSRDPNWALVATGALD